MSAALGAIKFIFAVFICVTQRWALHVVIKRQFFKRLFMLLQTVRYIEKNSTNTRDIDDEGVQEVGIESNGFILQDIT